MGLAPRHQDVKCGNSLPWSCRCPSERLGFYGNVAIRFSRMTDRMYEAEYEAMYRLEKSYWWYVARRALTAELLANEVKGRSGMRILDVGCGTGANMQAFAHYGKTTGVDTSIDALEFCRSRGVDTVTLSAAERLPFDDNEFDVVTAMDILEHTD